MPRGSAYHRNCLDEFRPAASTSRYHANELRHSRSDPLGPVGGNSNGTACAGGGAGDEGGAKGSAKSEPSAFRDEVLVLLPRPVSVSQCFAEAEDEPRPAQALQGLEAARLKPKVPAHVGIYDRVDPQDSIRDMITENDFYR